MQCFDICVMVRVGTGDIGLGGETEARHGRSLVERKLTRLLIGC